MFITTHLPPNIMIDTNTASGVILNPNILCECIALIYVFHFRDIGLYSPLTNSPLGAYSIGPTLLWLIYRNFVFWLKSIVSDTITEF